MCGIAGIWKSAPHGGTAPDVSLEGTVLAMLEPILHRGPDSGGVWTDNAAGIGLGHRRLAIVDLSPAGHQPMISQSGRYVITLNGEIYNFPEIKQRLQTEHRLPPLKGTSDTEIALAAIEAWGLEKALKTFNGMFAFALWDQQSKCLYLARDRVGKKPLYFGRTTRGSFVFASELKALFPLADFERKISQRAVAMYLELGYVPAPLSIFDGIHKLDAGSFALVRSTESDAQIQKYWSLPEIVTQSTGVRQNEASTSTPAHVLRDELETLLEDAVRIRMMSDVPLGALLSGGIDSSLVVGLMQRISPTPVRTFSIGFQEASHNEAAFAAEVAKHLGTAHEELYVTPSDCLDAVPLMARIYDEPFSDSSQIPTYLVSKLAKQHVTVCLSGDGGDEFFCGYNRYLLGGKLIRAKRKIPGPLLWGASSALGLLGPDSWSRLYDGVRSMIPAGNKIPQIGDKIHKLQALLSEKGALGIYTRLIQQWDLGGGILLGASGRGQSGDGPSGARDVISSFWNSPGPSDVERMMLADAMTYLPDDIMVKVDRANMAVALEGRAPLLDYRVIEHAWRMPLSAKLTAEGSKWPLREILYKMVPRELIDRPKMGFGVPMADWLRGPLRPWAEALLDKARIQNQGLLDPEVVWSTWQEHISGKRNWQAKLWNILMLQAWWDETRPTI